MSLQNFRKRVPTLTLEVLKLACPLRLRKKLLGRQICAALRGCDTMSVPGLLFQQAIQASQLNSWKQVPLTLCNPHPLQVPITLACFGFPLTFQGL